MRIQPDKVFSHVPLDAVEVITPSDRRIKRNIRGINEESILHRLQRLRVTRYRYTDEWRRVRGIEDREVRGVIAQEVNEVMPEYITVTERLTLPEQGFSIEDFHEVSRNRLPSIHLLARTAVR